MKTLLKYFILIPLLIFFNSCGGGSSGGGETSNPVIVDNLPIETQYFLQTSSSENNNTLAYSKQVSSFVDNVASLQNSMLDGDDSLQGLIDAYETAISMLYNPLYNDLSDADKKIVKDYYLLISTKIEDMQEILILKLNQLMIDEININTLAASSSLVLSPQRSSIYASSSLQRVPSLGFFKLISSIAVATKNLVSGSRSKNDQLIREALKTENSVEGTKLVLKEFGISFSSDADGENLYNVYKNLNADDQRKVDNRLTNMSVEILEDSSLYGGKYAQVDLFEAKRRSNATIVPLFKKTITDVGNIVVDTVGVQTPNLQIVNDYKDTVTIFKNLKTLKAPTKPYKIIATPKSKTEVSINDSNTSYENAKKLMNTLNNKDGYKNTKLVDLEDSIAANIKEKASKDGDGDNSVLSASVPISTMSVLPVVKSTDDNGSVLTLDIKLPSSLNDGNISLDVISVDQNETLDDDALPETLVVTEFEDVIPSDLSTTPLVVMDLVNTGTILSKAVLSQDSDSIKYRVTAVVNNIHILTNGYLEIFDGSAVMGRTDVELVNISSHTQTVTWDVDVVGAFAMMKFTRSDDSSYSDYIQLDGKSTSVTTESRYTGHSYFIDDENVEWSTDVSITFKSDNTLTGTISGTATDDTQSGITTGTLTGTWGNGSFLTHGDIQLCSSEGAGCGALVGTIYRGDIVTINDDTITIRLEDTDGFVFDAFTATKQD